MNLFRTCTEADREALMAYVGKEPEFNLFIIGDIENFGINNHVVNIYVNEQPNGWDSLILRYLDNYIVYSQLEEYDAEAAASFLKTQDVHIISGKESLLKALVPYMAERQLRSTYLSKLSHLSHVQLEVLDPSWRLRALNPEDAAAVVELYCLIEEFSANYSSRKEKATEGVALNLQSGGLAYGVFESEKLIAVAATSAENSQSAMIIGVATLPDYRKRGLASNVLVSLCSQSLSKGKEFLCLFYDNPEAGKIYQRLGFEEMGLYGMLK